MYLLRKMAGLLTCFMLLYLPNLIVSGFEVNNILKNEVPKQVRYKLTVAGTAQDYRVMNTK